MSARADGSPPLARRALERGALTAVGRRLTSARAENTTARPSATGPTAAHLRSRGEHNDEGSGASPAPAHLRSRGDHAGRRGPFWGWLGSPPLARRAQERRRKQRRLGRLTSALAESCERFLALRSSTSFRCFPQLTPSGSHKFARTATPPSVHYSGGRVIVTAAQGQSWKKRRSRCRVGALRSGAWHGFGRHSVEFIEWEQC